MIGIEQFGERVVGSLPIGALILIYLYFIDRKIIDTCRRLGKLEDHFIEHLIKKNGGG